MGQTGDIFIAVAQSPEEREACYAIRKTVFIEGQKVPKERERDGLDDEAVHFLALYEGKPVGTLRVRFKDDATAKIERLAVLEAMRGKRIGEALMRFAEADPAISQKQKIILQSQSYIVPFYERLGYKASGEEFLDVGIPHRLMTKEARTKAA
ncbi:MAG: GNAT family N-acetyltransferase [Alphaproteobacteria bacterium]